MKTANVVFLLSVIFLLAGCGGESGDPLTQARENICTDNGALKISFMDNMPPAQIFEHESFFIGVLLQNEGCFPIERGYVTLGGYEEDMTLIQSSYRQEILRDLDGKTIFSPAGGRAEMIFEAQNKQIRFDTKEASETLSVNACYTYHTIASAEVCINPNRADTLELRNDVCNAGKIVLDSKQGAPVIVDSVKSSTVRVGDRVIVSFDITVKNIGNGHVRDFADGTCHGNATVTLSDVTFSDRSTENDKDSLGYINCTPSQIVLKKDTTKNLFRCKAEFFDTFSAYTSILVMRLDYGYTITTDKSMLIKRI
ncbi:MAG: hypothetical protein ACTSWQ_05700 [Candidatus Thorarchaeota archaeon]